MFKVKFKLDRESFVKASLFVYRYHLKHSPKRFLGFIFIAMSQFGVVALLREGQSGLLLLSSILLIYWYFLRERIRKKIYEKSFKNEQEFTLLADGDGIEINGVKIAWSEISGILEFEAGFILKYSKKSLFIPKEVFGGEVKDFVSLLKSSTSRFLN